MADFTKLFDDLKTQLASLAEKDLKEFAGQGKADAMAFLDDSRAQLEEWFQLLTSGEIDEDEFRELVESQKDLAKMEALRKASAGQQTVESFRDSALNLIVKSAITAIEAG
jgi:hypothetical protein